MPPHLRPVLSRLAADVERAFAGRLREVALFGSYARGEAHEDSDVDVLVVIDALEPAEIATVSDVATVIALESGVRLAPLAVSSARRRELSAAKRGLGAEIERDGSRL